MHMLLLGALVGCSDQPTSTPDDSGAPPPDTGQPAGSLIVEMDTTLGLLTIELDEDAAPVTVENFLAYVDSGFFDGRDGGEATIFHRVIDDFMAQGGGYTTSGGLKPNGDAIVLESDNGLSNLRGTIAMARTEEPDSAVSQFYLNLVDNGHLDYRDADWPGYAVFGTLTDGLDVLDAIGAVATDSSDRPAEDIVITACQRQE